MQILIKINHLKYFGYTKTKIMKKKKTCWKGYEMKGLKKKGKRMVPNCVPVGRKKR